MKRFAWIALLSIACTEPTRNPTDVGPRDSGGTDAAPDAGDTGTTDTGTTDTGTTDAGSEDSGVIPTGICENKPCLTRIENASDWAFVSGPARAASRCDLTEETLFMLPKSEGTAIAETIYADGEQYDNLYFFLEGHLSNELPDLDPEVFYRTFERSDMREYWTGRIFRTEDGTYAFDVWADFYFGSPPDVSELEEIRTALMDTFAFPLAYAPQESGAIMRAEAFQNPPFELLLPAPCANEGCTNPNAFCVVIPEGTELCGHFAEGRDVPGELAAKIRLEAVAGNYEIPRQPGSMSMRLFAGGEFGTSRTPIDASANGTLTVTDVNGYLYYEYEQHLTADGDEIDLNWSLTSSQNPLILREPFLTETQGYGVINNSQKFPNGQIVLGSCTASNLNRFFAEGTFASGDSFRFTYRHRIPFGGSGPLLLTGAEVTFGGQRAVVNDYFQLVYAGEHHNWNNQFVILFDDPLTYMGHDIFGIWIDEQPLECCPPDAIHTLDAAGQPLDRLEVTGYIRAPSIF